MAHVVAGESLEGAVLRTLLPPARHPGHEETSAALTAAVDLAEEGSPTAEKAESLGAGCVHCTLVTPSVRDALLLSVNHSGDSDSTGSICGLPHDWVERVEGRPRIAALADDPAAESVRR